MSTHKFPIFPENNRPKYIPNKKSVFKGPAKEEDKLVALYKSCNDVGRGILKNIIDEVVKDKTKALIYGLSKDDRELILDSFSVWIYVNKETMF